LNCVDCVQFVGDLILSRGSVDENIILWEPVMPDPLPESADHDEPLLFPIPSHFEHLRTFEGMYDADFWFIRFGTDASHGHKTLACGNNTGDIFLWDIDAETGEMPFLKLQWTDTSKGKKKKSCMGQRRKRSAPTAVRRAVRWVSFSPDGNLFMASTDEGKLYVWDVVRFKARTKQSS
jgi:WD40 repeat protein